jgi:hypothetical protein
MPDETIIDELNQLELNPLEDKSESLRLFLIDIASDINQDKGTTGNLAVPVALTPLINDTKFIASLNSMINEMANILLDLDKRIKRLENNGSI